MSLEPLKEGNENFLIKEEYEKDREKMKELAEKGQNPKYVVISCGDSRIVDPNKLFDQEVGEILHLRNFGNVITDDMLEQLEFALKHFPESLTDIIIMGHTKCGKFAGNDLEAFKNILAGVKKLENSKIIPEKVNLSSSMLDLSSGKVKFIEKQHDFENDSKPNNNKENDSQQNNRQTNNMEKKDNKPNDGKENNNEQKNNNKKSYPFRVKPKLSRDISIGKSEGK